MPDRPVFDRLRLHQSKTPHGTQALVVKPYEPTPFFSRWVSFRRVFASVLSRIPGRALVPTTPSHWPAANAKCTVAAEHGPGDGVLRQIARRSAGGKLVTKESTRFAMPTLRAIGHQR